MNYYACPIAPEEKEIRVCGIPFKKAAASPNRRESRPCWITNLDICPAPSSFTIELGTSCETIYFFGLINSNDQGCGSWYVPTGETCQDFFLGDSIGSLIICYQSGKIDEIPLIIGFTSWWYRPWLADSLPFGKSGVGYNDLADALYVQDIYDKQEDGYVLAFEPRKESIHSITIEGNPQKAGYPLLYGLTLGNPVHSEGLQFLGSGDAAIKTLTSEYLENKSVWTDKTECLMRHLYTFADELPREETITDQFPEDYHGPVVHFEGSRLARMLTNQYMNILGESILKGSTGSCADYGTYRDYYMNAIGMFQPEGMTGGYFWTRDMARLYEERMRGGALEFAGQSIDIYDQVLYGYKDFQPQPYPHWVQCYLIDPVPPLYAAGYPDHMPPPADGVCHHLRMEPEGKRIEGNLENDGHGLMILARWQYFLMRGRDAEWLKNTLQITKDAADWFCYQLDYPPDVLELAEKYPDFDYDRIVFPDVLWSENESANYGACDAWNNGVAYWALAASEEMCSLAGDRVAAEKYRNYRQRLEKGLLNYLTREDPKWGKVFRAFKISNWQDYNEALGPLINSFDVIGFRRAEINTRIFGVAQNTYQMLIHRGKNGSKTYNFTRSYGYSYAFLAEGALLLDQIGDFTELLRNGSEHMYCKREYPWLCAEGTIVHESGAYWFRHNGIGNEVQVASFIRTVRMMLGVDDTALKLRIEPRIPLEFRLTQVEKLPYVTQSGGKSVCGKLAYRFHRTDSGAEWKLSLSEPADCIALRCGPFPREYCGRAAQVEAADMQFRIPCEPSGDSGFVILPELAQIKDLTVTVTF